jgi:hypothetical protein
MNRENAKVSTFDIIALDWNLILAVGFWDSKYQTYHLFEKKSQDHNPIIDFLDYLRENHGGSSREKGISLYSHRAVLQNNRLILSALSLLDQDVDFPAGLARIEWKNQKIAFEDSFLATGINPENLAKGFGISTEDFSEDVGDIWEYGIQRYQQEKFYHKLERDCLLLSEVITTVSKYLADIFGIPLQSSLAISAAKAFDRRFFTLRNIQSSYEPDKWNHYYRWATYGGRTEVYKKYGEHLNMYDIRRMFSSCMDVPVPVGRPRWITPNIDMGTVAEAKVKVPTDLLIGPLPYRYQVPGTGKTILVFPVGEFQGWWDTRELKNATKYGVDLAIIRQVNCEEAPILKDFMDFMFREESESNEEKSMFLKAMEVRLLGKFGQNPLDHPIRHVSETGNPNYLWSPIDSEEKYWEGTPLKLKESKSPYIRPAINMRIRAEARIRHTNILYKVKDLYYCDTDSIYTPEELEVGPVPGQLKKEGFMVRAYFLGCKTYGYITPEGKLRQRTAGFSDTELTEYDFQKALKGEETLVVQKRHTPLREMLGDPNKELWRKIRKRLAASEISNRLVCGDHTEPIKLPIPSVLVQVEELLNAP